MATASLLLFGREGDKNEGLHMPPRSDITLWNIILTLTSGYPTICLLLFLLINILLVVHCVLSRISFLILDLTEYFIILCYCLICSEKLFFSLFFCVHSSLLPGLQLALHNPWSRTGFSLVELRYMLIILD